MKFLYEYRTSDNVRHEGVISAPDRDRAFAILKGQGIKPGRLAPAPGLANRLSGRLGRRLVAALAFAALAAALLLTLFRPRPADDAAIALADTTRRQPYGDLAVIEAGRRQGWPAFFSDIGDRFLASYAVPGVKAHHALVSDDDLARVLKAPPSVRPELKDSLEGRQLVAMLSGLKAELRDFLADGGTIAEYRVELSKREDIELAHFNRAKRELDELVAKRAPPQAIRQAWLKNNDELRKMGIRLLSLPIRATP